MVNSFFIYFTAKYTYFSLKILRVFSALQKNIHFQSYFRLVFIIDYRLSIIEMFIIDESDQIFLLKSRRVVC